MRATSNPGGPGHSWVRKHFLDPSPPGEAFWATGEDGEVIDVPTSNADFHKMEWADIHALAEEAKQNGAIGNKIGME